jgi:hypothetical protein
LQRQAAVDVLCEIEQARRKFLLTGDGGHLAIPPVGFLWDWARARRNPGKPLPCLEQLAPEKVLCSRLDFMLADLQHRHRAQRFQHFVQREWIAAQIEAAQVLQRG